jgi:hypothetical protein
VSGNTAPARDETDAAQEDDSKGRAHTHQIGDHPVGVTVGRCQDIRAVPVPPDAVHVSLHGQKKGSIKIALLIELKFDHLSPSVDEWNHSATAFSLAPD